MSARCFAFRVFEKKSSMPAGSKQSLLFTNFVRIILVRSVQKKRAFFSCVCFETLGIVYSFSTCERTN